MNKNKMDRVFIEMRPRWVNISILITAGFLFGFASSSACMKQLDTLQANLDPPQLQLYESIKKERCQIFSSSLATGFLFAFIYTIISFYLLNRRACYPVFCESSCIILATTYFLYILSFKKKNMLLDANLDIPDTQKWFRVYQCMQQQFHIYFILGFIIVGFFLQMVDIFSPPVLIGIAFPATTKKRSKKSKKST